MSLSPVEGVALGFQFEYEAVDKPRKRWMAHGSAKTDAQGKWRFKGAPAKTIQTTIYTQHSDFIRGDGLTLNHAEPLDELRKKALFWLGQSDDPRAAKALQDIIEQP